jgi:hypothetical protein
VQLHQLRHQLAVLHQLHLLGQRALQLPAHCPCCGWLHKQALVVVGGVYFSMPLQALPRAPQCISQPRTSRDYHVPPRSILLEGPIAHEIRELGENPPHRLSPTVRIRRRSISERRQRACCTAPVFFFST